MLLDYAFPNYRSVHPLSGIMENLYAACLCLINDSHFSLTSRNHCFVEFPIYKKFFFLGRLWRDILNNQLCLDYIVNYLPCDINLGKCLSLKLQVKT